MTDYKSMFEQAVRTLAAIDEALGIGDDGCGDPDQTLTAIAELKAQKVGAGETAKKGNEVAEKVVIGNAELWHGDCREVLPLLPQSDLILTDPPYGIGINKSHRLATSRGHGGETWDDKPVPQWLMLMLQDCAQDLIVWGGNYYTMGPARCFLIWDKQNDGRDFADCEMAWTSIDAVARIFRKRPMNMDGGKEHPTQKPIDLMAWCIDKVANAQTVCDPFMGSGTTGVACAMLGKDFTGIERERKYFDLACERISRAQAQGQLLPPEQKPAAVQEALL